MADNEINPSAKSSWLFHSFVALTTLIILFALAYLISGREIIERPILIFFLVLAWFGLLSGMVLSRSSP